MPERQTSTQGSSGLLIAASPPHQAWFSPTMDSSLCLHSVVPSVTFSLGLTSSCLQQLRGSGTVLSCSSQLHLTLCPCCCSKLQCHSPRPSMFPPGDCLTQHTSPQQLSIHWLCWASAGEPRHISSTVLCSLTATRAETGGLALAIPGVKVHERAMPKCTAAQKLCPAREKANTSPLHGLRQNWHKNSVQSARMF